MTMFNLLEYNSSYPETTGSLWFCSEDEATNYNAYFANTDAFKIFQVQG